MKKWVWIVVVLAILALLAAAFLLLDFRITGQVISDSDSELKTFDGVNLVDTISGALGFDLDEILAKNGFTRRVFDIVPFGSEKVMLSPGENEIDGTISVFKSMRDKIFWFKD